MGPGRSKLFWFNIHKLINQTRPKDKYELFNLRHAQARNVIERIFGVLKQRFRILLLAPRYNVEIQSRIPAALVALHNFIKCHDPQDKTQVDSDPDHVAVGFYAGDDSLPHGTGGVEDEENDSEASRRRNQIAGDMWKQYTVILEERAQAGLLEDESSDTEDGTDDE